MKGDKMNSGLPDTLFGHPVVEVDDLPAGDVGEIKLGTLNDYAKAAIKNYADRIREDIQAGTLFGAPLDMDDLDSAIVAAFCAGKYGFERFNDANP
jgi:hypothetical protein